MTKEQIKDQIYDILVPMVGWALVVTAFTVGSLIGFFIYYSFIAFMFTF